MRRRAADDAVVALLAERMAPDARDDASARAFLERYGPFDRDAARRVLGAIVPEAPSELHPSVLLEAMRRHLGGAP